MCTSTVDELEAARPHPLMVIGLVTAAPASGTVTSVPLVARQAVDGGVVVGGVVVGGSVPPPPITVVTVTVVLVHPLAIDVSALFSALSTVRPHRVFTAAHSVM